MFSGFVKYMVWQYGARLLSRFVMWNWCILGHSVCHLRLCKCMIQNKKKCKMISSSFPASPGQGHMTLVRWNMPRGFSEVHYKSILFPPKKCNFPFFVSFDFRCTKGCITLHAIIMQRLCIILSVYIVTCQVHPVLVKRVQCTVHSSF